MSHRQYEKRYNEYLLKLIGDSDSIEDVDFMTYEQFAEKEKNKYLDLYEERSD